jgi:hypothetical protein
VPAKGKSRVTAAQRKRIAAGKLVGRTNKQLAGELDLHPDTVGRAATDYRTTTLILSFKARQQRQLDKALDLALQSLLRDLKSNDNDLVVSARRDLLRYVTAGDPPLYRVGDVGSTDGDFTLEELLQTMRRFTTEKS